jgi:NAD(P)-dependent dehydrogenase (short-subunit alcohol dehydrogenase family)
MPGRLEGKVCLISGSTGIAAATAELAAREGGSIFVSSRTTENCTALARKIRADGGVCHSHPADLTDAASVAEVVRRCIQCYHRIDALYNVAGISGRRYGDGPLHECTEEGWDLTLATNVKSMFLLSRLVIGQMLGQAVGPNGLRGAILNMASVLGFSPQSDYFATHAYTASKGAIISLSKAMASYYAPHKIRVNVVAPALVRTPMSQRAQEDERIQEFIKRKQPLCDGMIAPEEVARASVFLLSDESRHITGGLLTVDGGWCVS